jgi:mannose-6-phosphate isomerase-like protein (cupin superfamily)
MPNLPTLPISIDQLGSLATVATPGKEGSEKSRGERLTFGELTIDIHADADDTGGAMAVIEEVPPLADTPLHVHANEDELFYALEGEHLIQLGDEERLIGPGESAFGPRGVPHAQRRVVPGEGRMLVVFTPGGFEDFFRDLAEAERKGELGPDAYAAASQKFGLTWL